MLAGWGYVGFAGVRVKGLQVEIKGCSGEKIPGWGKELVDFESISLQMTSACQIISL